MKEQLIFSMLSVYFTVIYYVNVIFYEIYMKQLQNTNIKIGV